MRSSFRFSNFITMDTGGLANLIGAFGIVLPTMKGRMAGLYRHKGSCSRGRDFVAG